MLEIIIAGIAVYAVLGWAFSIIVKDYIKELTNKLRVMDDMISETNLMITIHAPLWLCYILVGIAMIFWPVTVIAAILNAEWKYSKLTQS